MYFSRFKRNVCKYLKLLLKELYKWLDTLQKDCEKYIDLSKLGIHYNNLKVIKRILNDLMTHFMYPRIQVKYENLPQSRSNVLFSVINDIINR